MSALAGARVRCRSAPQVIDSAEFPSANAQRLDDTPRTADGKLCRAACRPDADQRHNRLIAFDDEESDPALNDSRVPRTIEDEGAMRVVFDGLCTLVSDGGRIVVSAYAPHFAFGVPRAEASRDLPPEVRCETSFAWHRTMRATGRVRFGARGARPRPASRDAVG